MNKTGLTALTAAAVLVAVLTVVNITVFQFNRQAQAEAQQRRAFVQQSMQLEQLYREMINVLAQLAERNNDDQLRALLAVQGVTYSAKPAAPASAAPSR